MREYDIFGDRIETQTKKCIYCEETKSIDEFPKHKIFFDGYDSRCKLCIKKRNNIVKQIKKSAPLKPNCCDCCGKIPKQGNGRRKVGLALDHCTKTNKFRGWLCVDCNGAIGLLGDNIDGVKKALYYLEKNG